MFRSVTSATSQKSQKLSGNKERREAFCPCANVGVFHWLTLSGEAGMTAEGEEGEKEAGEKQGEEEEGEEKGGGT